MGRQRRARGQMVAVVVVTALAVGGCASGADIGGATLAPLSSSATQSSAADSASSMMGSTEASSAAQFTQLSSTEGTATSPASDAATTTDAPWAGLNLTEAQLADAEAAIAAYRGYRKVSDLTFSDPKKDWAVEVYTYAADPVASNLLNFVKDPAFQQGIGVGRTTIEPRVTAAGAAAIELSDCVDNSASTFIDPSGQSLIAPDSPDFYRRHPATVTITRQSNRWLVTEVVNDFTVQC